MTRGLTEALKARKIHYRENVLTASLCTFRIGGPARIVVEPCCVGELIEAVTLCIRLGLSYAVIGKGSNLLFDDGTIDTVLIRTVRLDALRMIPGGELCALCGASLSSAAYLAARHGFADLCFAAGIPGSVGGGLYMNAGAHGSAMLSVPGAVRILNTDTLKIETLFNEKLNNVYRSSEFKSKKCVILDAVLHFKERADPAAALAEIRELAERRRALQPLDLPCAGSVFRRPSPEVALSKILDDLGCKKMRVGGAEVSEKHAGFIVNIGGATAQDVQALMVNIQNIVERECGFRPSPELVMIPRDV